MKNKPIFRPAKMANILQIKFSNGFSFNKMFWLKFRNRFLAETKQLYEWFCPSVCLSFTPFSLCSHHGIIMKFSEVIANGRSEVYAKGQGQRSKVKVTEIKTQLIRFRTITPVWFHISWWNGAQCLMLYKRCVLLIFKVICQISRSHSQKKLSISNQIGRFRTVSPVWIHRWLWDDAQILE